MKDLLPQNDCQRASALIIVLSPLSFVADAFSETVAQNITGMCIAFFLTAIWLWLRDPESPVFLP